MNTWASAINIFFFPSATDTTTAFRHSVFLRAPIPKLIIYGVLVFETRPHSQTQNGLKLMVTLLLNLQDSCGYRNESPLAQAPAI
ncbi:hypothetical protein I79_000042 [Cricetulus griseus]|uniref:Uncharacterized protein n=1 Tax=Cricetulus griseus TaxID=10029 RepID=G3GR99_CRIGR|nr:hypothetical protein I79_000042 [Cricetulus griseus]